MLDGAKHLPKEFLKNDINLLRANIVFDVLNDPPRSWNVMNYFTNSSREEIEKAVKKKKSRRQKI